MHTHKEYGNDYIVGKKHVAFDNNRPMFVLGHLTWNYQHRFLLVERKIFGLKSKIN